MARGQRKSLDEKINAKKEVIAALLTRVDSEKRELSELYEQKRLKDLETVGELMEDYGLAPDEIAKALEQFCESKKEAAS